LLFTFELESGTVFVVVEEVSFSISLILP